MSQANNSFLTTPKLELDVERIVILNKVYQANEKYRVARSGVVSHKGLRLYLLGGRWRWAYQKGKAHPTTSGDPTPPHDTQLHPPDIMPSTNQSRPEIILFTITIT